MADFVTAKDTFLKFVANAVQARNDILAERAARFAADLAPTEQRIAAARAELEASSTAADGINALHQTEIEAKAAEFAVEDQQFAEFRAALAAIPAALA